ncbi:Homogentisate 1,2-dioxygenase [Cytospora mali]|uniref:homogentisate 1,2-dioxygenase n=1 Tax=Cytospora mali TaxID=578113 RepID=A0A194URL2_CYTMA|nr:Homogentisate 1,2-dioxygenase [Valsa mali var. pyri (nom. inval.)]
METLFINDDGLHHSAVLGHISKPTTYDPYRYQHGFGNHHASEAFSGALPRNGTNLPQKHPYGLYAEHLNGTSFISTRESVLNTWMYRVRPSVAHRPLQPSNVSSEIESCFLPLNPKVDFTPLTHTWGPLRSPVRETAGKDEKANARQPVTFVEGLHTLCGHGDPTLKEGMAVHVYAFDADMTRQAFVNNDGEFLIVPQRGTLDIQTELGHLRVPPGSIAVLPPGFRFSVSIASFPETSGASGYILEVFGTHFRLPELGPLGANGLAHVRDFQYPVASFDIDLDPQLSTPESSPFLPMASPSSHWRVLTKLAGKFYQYTQHHTPFDVVAWHGRYSPYKYNLSHFTHLTANTDQLDPTAYCVLIAPSKWPGVNLVDFCAFGEKYAVAKDTLRIPYHHRTMATELVGIIKGKYGGSVRKLEAGGLSFEQGYMPHGESYECWKRETERELGAEVVGKDFMGFMFHVASHVGLTRWATETHPDIRLDDPDFWDDLRAPFADKLHQASQALEKTRIANEAAIQAELTALAFEVMVNRRRLSATDDEGDEVQGSPPNGN